ncbi:MAG: lysylphosphatidylglycerol synthase domain-containing protein [Rhizobiaceae bacterium]|nr:lysylphosphatidylglycerol synthase domain-containing protein [Rhizobiaceae bacterium]MCV0407463.1 lysylphosphatidylglycerol synthase domain-containing protein [Rhizobiaceae bacterium]
MRALGTFLRPAIAIAAVVLAGFLLRRTFQGYELEDIAKQVMSAPPGRIAAAGAFAVASYACLTLFDYFALRYAGRPLAYRKAALASFTALSLGHNIGFAALSSGAVRYRFYSRWGLSAGDVANVVLFCGMTVGIGLGVLALTGLILRPDLAGQLIGIAPSTARWSAVATGLLVLAYVVLCARLDREFQLYGWRIRLPPVKLALAQLLIGPANFLLVAACLHQSLAATSDIPYIDVATAYSLANIAALVSHVPGGLGVIEAVVTMVLSHAEVITGLVLFRLVYFLAPLVVGGTLLVTAELFAGRASAPEDRRA